MIFTNSETANQWIGDFKEFLGTKGFVIREEILTNAQIPDVIGAIFQSPYIILNQEFVSLDPCAAFAALVHIVGHGIQVQGGNNGPLTLSYDLFDTLSMYEINERERIIQENEGLDLEATCMGLGVLRVFCNEKEISNDIWEDMHRCVSLYHATDSLQFTQFLKDGRSVPRYPRLTPLKSYLLPVIKVPVIEVLPYDAKAKPIVFHAAPNKKKIVFDPANDSGCVYQHAAKLVSGVHTP